MHSPTTATTIPTTPRIQVTRHPTPVGTVLAATHRGRVRRQNQDAHGVAGRTLALADGMGGHPRGAEAAEAAVQAALATPPPAGASPPTLATFVQDALLRGHRAVAALAGASPRPADRHPGTTLVLAHVAPTLDRVEVGWAGDSRLYLVHAQGLLRVTEDHVVAPGKPAVTRGLGANFVGGLAPDVGTLHLPLHATLLLCSDGLHTYVPPSVLDREVRAASGREDTVRRLVSAAFRAGAPDNVTVMLLRVGAP